MKEAPEGLFVKRNELAGGQAWKLASRYEIRFTR